MSDSVQQAYYVTIVGLGLGIVLLSFIVAIVFLYQRRQFQHQAELNRMKDIYDQQIMKAQLEMQEETFKNIAQDLHDNIGQMLSMVKLTLAAVTVDPNIPHHDKLMNSREVLNKAIMDLSHLTKSLHSDRIAHVGIVEAIQYEVDSIRKSGLVKINSAIEKGGYYLGEQNSVVIFRMFQEMINNALKHAKATQINVSINNPDGNTFVLSINDDGIGFNVQEMKSRSNSSTGVGLRSMTNRAALIGAKFDLQSKPGSGTKVTITLPLSR